MTDEPRPDAEELEPAVDPTDEAAEAVEGQSEAAQKEKTENEETQGDEGMDNIVEIEEIDDVSRLEREVAEHRDRLLRTVAEMENLRKRTRREVADSRRFAQADLLRPLLEVLDNFDRALGHAPEGDADQSFRDGVAMIAQSFRQVLLDRGVKIIDAENEPFDPARHEAVGQAPATDEVEAGMVLAVVQTGYTLDDMVLRASRVIVAQ